MASHTVCMIWYIMFYLFISPFVYSRVLEQINHDIKDLLRRKRYLLFPNPLDSETKVQVLFGLGLPMEGEVSMTLGYVLKCNYNLPFNSTDFTEVQKQYKKRDIKKSDNSSKKEHEPMSRWDLYRLLESALDGLGCGRACLLRAVCEAAEVPFSQTHGLLGELLTALLKPSSTMEQVQEHADHEYYAAELIGKFSDGRDCAGAFPECKHSPLNFFPLF